MQKYVWIKNISTKCSDVPLLYSSFIRSQLGQWYLRNSLKMKDKLFKKVKSKIIVKSTSGIYIYIYIWTVCFYFYSCTRYILYCMIHEEKFANFREVGWRGRVRVRVNLDKNGWSCNCWQRLTFRRKSFPRQLNSFSYSRYIQ